MYRPQPTTLVRCAAIAQRAVQQPQIASVARRAASTHAISNPTLANIEKRWEGLPLQEQADLWMALRDRMKGNWKELTLQEKKAGESGPSVIWTESDYGPSMISYHPISWLLENAERALQRGRYQLVSR